jgi:hypothetical protein
MINHNKSYFISPYLFITDRNKSASNVIIVFALSSFAFPLVAFLVYPDAMRDYPEVYSFLRIGKTQFY